MFSNIIVTDNSVMWVIVLFLVVAGLLAGFRRIRIRDFLTMDPTKPGDEISSDSDQKEM